MVARAAVGRAAEAPGPARKRGPAAAGIDRGAYPTQGWSKRFPRTLGTRPNGPCRRAFARLSSWQRLTMGTSVNRPDPMFMRVRAENRLAAAAASPSKSAETDRSRTGRAAR